MRNSAQGGLSGATITAASETVQIPASATLDFGGKGLTLAAWVKPDPVVNTSDTVVHKAGVFSLGLFTTSTGAHVTALDPAGGQLTSTGKVTTNAWSHIAVTYDGVAYRFYINGVFDSAHARPGTLLTRTMPVFVGCSSGWTQHPGTSCFTNFYEGAIDELGIRSRMLSAADIQQLFAGPLRQGDNQGDSCDACPGNPAASCAPVTCLDRDRDGYGVQGASACTAGQPQKLDCNDGDPRARPGAVEACDGVDNDCDGRTDEACLANPVATNYVYNAFNQLLASGPSAVCTGDADCDACLSWQRTSTWQLLRARRRPGVARPRRSWRSPTPPTNANAHDVG